MELMKINNKELENRGKKLGETKKINKEFREKIEKAQCNNDELKDKINQLKVQKNKVCTEWSRTIVENLAEKIGKIEKENATTTRNEKVYEPHSNGNIVTSNDDYEENLLESTMHGKWSRYQGKNWTI